MNIQSDKPYMIFEKEYNGKKYYKVGLSRKKQDGTYENGYVDIQFKQDVEIHNKERIYLKNALGKDIYSIGVALCIVGCSLTLSISSTLILLAIINEELKQHIQKENTPNPSSNVIPFGVNNATPFEPQK